MRIITTATLVTVIGFSAAPALSQNIASEIVNNPETYEIVGPANLGDWPGLFVKHTENGLSTLYLCYVNTNTTTDYKMSCNEVH
jgi:hypothetical protein